METAIYLIDSNSLIQPFNTFYRFEFIPRFWELMEKEIENGTIAVLDLVKTEIEKGKDQLSDWINSLSFGNYIDRRDENIIEKYRNVLSYIQNSKYYSVAALHEWARSDVADPWLIATAAERDLKIVTFEKNNSNLSETNPTKKIKIPDVAKEFNISTCDLFKMMEEFGWSL